MRNLTATLAVMLFVLMPIVSVAETDAPLKPVAGVEVGTVGAYGYDLVALFPGGSKNPNIGKHVRGGPRHAVTHEGVAYFFESDKNAERFEEDPAHYLPGIGGYCLLGMYRRAADEQHNGNPLPPPGDPRAMSYGNGKWYFHGGTGAERIFEEDPDSINKRTAEAVRYYKKLFEDQLAEQ